MTHEPPNDVPETCRDVIDLLSDYIEGELPPEDAAALTRHMADCPNCERFFRSLETTIDWTRRLKVDDVPGDVMDRLRVFLKSRIDQPKP